MSKPIYAIPYASFSAFDRAALRTLVRRLPAGFCALEVGSWLGQGSTQVLIEEARHAGGTVYCVDTWRGNANVAQHREIVDHYDVLGTFMHNVAAAGGLDVTHPMVMPSAAAARVTADASFDLVFIDADHSYYATLEDVCLWLPKVKPGGILCGHDCEGRVADFGRDRLVSGRHEDTITGDHGFSHVHPGVILALEDGIGGRQRLCAEEPVVAEDGTTGRSTIWYLPR